MDGSKTARRDKDPRKGRPSCSEAHRIIACPGYLYAKQKWQKVPEPESPIAESGTQTHEAIECLIDGKPIEIPLNEIEEYVAEQCAVMQDKLIIELFGDPSKIKKHWVKTRLWLVEKEDSLLSGEPDYFCTDGNGTWLLTDYKRGPKAVPVATKNWQIQAYLSLLAFSDQFKEFKFDTLYGAIFQPLISSSPVVVKMTVDDCFRIRLQLLRALWRSMDVTQPRYPGDHCTYCSLRGQCIQCQATGMVLAHKFTDVQSLSNEQLVALYPKLTRIEDVCKSVREAFKHRVMSGEITEYEVYQHPAGFTVDHPNDLWKLVKEFITDSKEFTSLLSVPMGKIRQAWAEKFAEAGNMTVAAGLRAWKDQIEPHLIAKEPQVRVRKRNEIRDSK